jgi:hypothetical protein
MLGESPQAVVLAQFAECAKMVAEASASAPVQR